MNTVFQQFEAAARKFGPKKAIGFFEDDELVYWTYQEFCHRVVAVSESLRKHNLRKGDRLGILAPNGPEWGLIYLAAARLGMIVIPIHVTLSGKQIQRILQQSKVKFLVLGKTSAIDSFNILQELLPNLLVEIRKLIEIHLPTVELIILLGKPTQRAMDRKRSLYVSELLAHGNLLLEGREFSGSKGPPPVSVNPEDTFTIMYTSGTTGEMKGVMLSHRNLVANALAAGKLNGVSPDDVALSLLPLSHAFEQNAGFLHQLFHGTTIVYSRGPAYLLDDLRLVQPTWMGVVPRILEKLKLGIQQGILAKGAWAGKLFRLALRQEDVYRRMKRIGNPLALPIYLLRQISDEVFFKKIRGQLGGRLNRMVSGGAPLDPKIAEFFTAIGVKILEGYGLTEAAPTVTVNPVKRPKIGSVGLALPGVKVRIGRNEEILIKGPKVMKGYESGAKETRKVLLKGWLHSGDQGKLDSEGYLYVTGRLKEILVTSYGKNIVPGPLERQLEKSPWIKQAMVVGDGRPYVIALVAPDQHAVESRFPQEEFNRLSWSQLCRHPKVHEFLSQEVDRHSTAFSDQEKPKKILVLSEEFTELNSCLTPTLKLRRKNIEARHRENIEGLYAAG